MMRTFTTDSAPPRMREPVRTTYTLFRGPGLRMRRRVLGPSWRPEVFSAQRRSTAGGDHSQDESGPFVPEARPTNLERLSIVSPDARGLVRPARVRWPVARLHDSVRAAFCADDAEAPQGPRSVRPAGRILPEREARARRPPRDAPDRALRHRGSSTAVDPPDPLPVSNEHRELPVAELRAVRPTHAGGRKAAGRCPAISEGPSRDPRSPPRRHLLRGGRDGRAGNSRFVLEGAARTPRECIPRRAASCSPDERRGEVGTRPVREDPRRRVQAPHQDGLRPRPDEVCADDLCGTPRENPDRALARGGPRRLEGEPNPTPGGREGNRCVEDTPRGPRGNRAGPSDCGLAHRGHASDARGNPTVRGGPRHHRRPVGGPGAGNRDAPLLPLCNGRDELAGEFREGRQRGLLLCHPRRRRLVPGEARGVAASPELHELAEHFSARVLPGALRPLPPPTAREVAGAALVLFVRVHRGLGALLRGDDARPGLRRPSAEARATPGCAPAGLPLHLLDHDAHGRRVVGRRDPVLHGECVPRSPAGGAGGEARDVGSRLPELHPGEADDQEAPGRLVREAQRCRAARIPRFAACIRRAPSRTRARTSPRARRGARALTHPTAGRRFEQPHVSHGLLPRATRNAAASRQSPAARSATKPRTRSGSGFSAANRTIALPTIIPSAPQEARAWTWSRVDTPNPTPKGRFVTRCKEAIRFSMSSGSDERVPVLPWRATTYRKPRDARAIASARSAGVAGATS